MVATAAGGYVTGFVSLFVARMFVGVGEAALSPAAYSMLADYFPPERRARAMSIYTSGVYIGSATAFIVGGLVIQATSQAGEVVFPLLGKGKDHGEQSLTGPFGEIMASDIVPKKKAA